MPDVFTKKKRSEVMSRIRGRGNRDTELALIILLRLNKITGWRRNQKLFGKPDFVFRRARLAVFVDGCFWHGCPKHCNLPAGNRAFWRRKFAANLLRDRLVARTLRARGWRVLRIWEHDLAKRQSYCAARILNALDSPLSCREATADISQPQGGWCRVKTEPRPDRTPETPDGGPLNSFVPTGHMGFCGGSRHGVSG